MRSGLFAAALALILAGCREPTARNTLSLPLLRVDNLSLPVTLPSGSGSVQVTSGRITGSRFELGCTWTITFSDGTRTGSNPGCSLSSPFDIVELTLDLAGPPGPSGSHIYSFGTGE